MTLNYIVFVMSEPKYHEIDAVHERNLRELLESLGLLEDVLKGHINCNFCKKKITLDNLRCIYPKNDEILFCCDDIRCFEQTLEDSREVKTDV